jgi:hypothetical protein
MIRNSPSLSAKSSVLSRRASLVLPRKRPPKKAAM